MSLRERDNVAVHNYLKQEKSSQLSKSVNVIDLMNKVEFEKKKGKNEYYTYYDCIIICSSIFCLYNNIDLIFYKPIYAIFCVLNVCNVF